MGRLSEVFGSSTEQLEYKLQIDILEHTACSVSTVCTSPEVITCCQGAPFQHFRHHIYACSHSTTSSFRCDPHYLQLLLALSNSDFGTCLGMPTIPYMGTAV